MSAGIETVLEVLEEAGFERLPQPLVVAGSTFDFDAAARGTGVSHDLVVVATSTTSSRHLVRLLAGLALTLDQARSRRPVSLVLVGSPPSAPDLADLEEHARVLAIEGDDPDPEQVRRGVAILMPLSLPAAGSRGRDPLAEVVTALGSSASTEHHSLIEAARVGPDEVRDSLRRYIDDAATGVPTVETDL